MDNVELTCRTVDPQAPLYLPMILAALSVGTDLANDQPSGSAMRVAHIARRMAETMALPAETQLDVFYTSMTRFLGCTAYAHETSVMLGGDDLAFHSAFATIDMQQTTKVLHAAMTRLAPDKGLTGQARAFLGTIRGGRPFFEGYASAHCEVASLLARRLCLSESVQTALTQTYERWDGAGGPRGLSGDAISLVTRIVQVARTAELVCREREHHDQSVIQRLRSRAGAALDPTVVEVCVREIDHVTAIVQDASLSNDLLRLPEASHPPMTLDKVALTFADYADLKSVHRAGHSRGVADLAVAAATSLGLEASDVEQLRYAALLHDLGMVTVPTGILESTRPLSLMEQEKIRLHPYYTGRVLSLSPLATVAKIAGAHHERADASGYPAGIGGNALPMSTRILAAADVYHALLERRPHRDACTPEDAARIMEQEVAAGRLEQRAAFAVLRAVGHRPTSTNGKEPVLTARELEVLRLVASGYSDKEIAAKLGISPRTVHHHVSRVYQKINVSSRAAATLYAVENDLLTTG